MKQLFAFTTLAVAGMLLSSCVQKVGERSSQDGRTITEILANSPVAAQRVVVGEDTVVVARLAEEPEPVTLLASEMFDDVELIKLEDTEEALTGGGKHGFPKITLLFMMVIMSGFTTVKESL